MPSTVVRKLASALTLPEGPYLTELGEHLPPVRRFFYEIGRRFIHPKTIDLSGVKVSLEGLSDVCKRSLLFGELESPEREIAEALVKYDDVVVDLGGGIGYTASAVGMRLDSKHVTVIEPNNRLHEKIRANAKLNGVDVIIIPNAIVYSDGRVNLTINGNEMSSGLSGLKMLRGQTEEIQVDGLKAQRLFPHLTPAPTMLLVDIEGAEQYMDWRNLPRSVKKMVIEFHPQVHGSAPEDISPSILAAGFAETHSLKHGTVRGYQRSK